MAKRQVECITVPNSEDDSKTSDSAQASAAMNKLTPVLSRVRVRMGFVSHAGQRIRLRNVDTALALCRISWKSQTVGNWNSLADFESGVILNPQTLEVSSIS